MKLCALLILSVGLLMGSCAEEYGGAELPLTGVGKIITEDIYNKMFPYRNYPGCSGKFYSYEAFLTAANFFSHFGTDGDDETQRRELAAFFGQTSHQTTGGGDSSTGGSYAWGYCYIEQLDKPINCASCPPWDCVLGKKYYGRGPMQLSYNCNYGLAGQQLGYDLVKNPDLVATDPVVSFKTAIWFWMTPQGDKPSSHKVITNKWIPTMADLDANRLPGYGVITNIINGGLECGRGPDARVNNRIGFYKKFCDMLGVSYGDNLDCFNQRPFGQGVERIYDDVKFNKLSVI